MVVLMVGNVSLADVFLDTPSGQFRAGGTFFSNAPFPRPADPITTERFLECFPNSGLTEADVRIVQDGATDTFETDTVIGFAFRFRRNVGPFNANEAYSYKIRNGSLAPPGSWISLSLTSDETTYNSEFTVSATFDASVSGFDENDITVTNGSATNLSGSGNTYTFSVTPDGDGTVGISVDPGAVTAGDNTNAGAELSVTVDSTPPSGYSINFDQTAVNITNESAVSFTFAGAEIGADYAYSISSSGGGQDLTGVGTIATATDQVTSINTGALGDGTLTLSVTLTDTANNEGSAATATTTKDTVAPTGHSVSFTQTLVNSDNQSAVGFSFTGAEVGASYSYTISSDGGAPM